MIFDLYAVVSNFSVKRAHILIRSFFRMALFLCCCDCNHCHQENQNRCSKMGLTSHLSDAYNAFSSCYVSSSLLLSLMKISMMTSLTMMVPGPGSPPIHAFLHFLSYPLIVLVDCHVIESPNPFVVSVDYFQFPAQKFSSFKFRILNMITVCCCFAHSFKIVRIP